MSRFQSSDSSESGKLCCKDATTRTTSYFVVIGTAVCLDVRRVWWIGAFDQFILCKQLVKIRIVWAVTGLFVLLHFRSRERKDHRENFRSRGTFVPWNIRCRGAKSRRTFVPWNFRSCRTFAPQERMFEELSFHGTFAPLEPSLHPQTTFVPFNFRSRT